MNISLQYRGLNARSIWLGLIRVQFNKLEKLAAIAAARITVERQNRFDQLYRVVALLEVPGPDFHAEASDYTFVAALSKVVRNLERQIRGRKKHPIARRKSNVQLGLVPVGRFSAGFCTSRA
jgi:ribosome-associated translation inhibitor RaiA